MDIRIYVFLVIFFKVIKWYFWGKGGMVSLLLFGKGISFYGLFSFFIYGYLLKVVYG